MTPTTETDVAEAIASATGPVRIEGGGTRPIGKQVASDTLSVAALSGISLYEPGALTVVAKAGTPVAEIEETLAKENQRLAFEPMDHRDLLGTAGVPTIGGVVAGNVSGPRRIAVGACRDFMLGVRFVDGTGTILKNGGRVMKNVTGYDLVKLLTGAHGTLGVLTEVSLKVLPMPETSATLHVHDLSPLDAVAAMSGALGSPFEVTGAAYNGDVLLRVEGFEASVSYRLSELTKKLGHYGQISQTNDPEASAEIWQSIRDVQSLQAHGSDVWKLSVKPSSAPAVLEMIQAEQTLLDWGGGLIWAALPAGRDLRAQIKDVNGHATLVRASAETLAAIPAFHPETPVVAKIGAELRRKFDPRDILNRGLMA
ncbi:glycolate oxidase subunit GlcE [Nereida sp. MMG025]|uniref:glycolate oxidase subunit GlcE n=1 Tax=Nereida sp. MMG025 TaxID=2909981 RepID=UPI001EFFE8AD|nr:glycolate oxidase subunit GlcE [Nereida sp. MMG025]MCF6445456.1 glycolate oxidase subunit GlcE [Nereida sp. MMG025]